MVVSLKKHQKTHKKPNNNTYQQQKVPHKLQKNKTSARTFFKKHTADAKPSLVNDGTDDTSRMKAAGKNEDYGTNHCPGSIQKVRQALCTATEEKSRKLPGRLGCSNFTTERRRQTERPRERERERDTSRLRHTNFARR